MKKAIKKGFMLGIGTISLTTKAAERILDDIIKKSRISRKDSEKLVKNMLSEANKQAAKIGGYVEREANKQIKKVKPLIKKGIKKAKKRSGQRKKR